MLCDLLAHLAGILELPEDVQEEQHVVSSPETHMPQCDKALQKCSIMARKQNVGVALQGEKESRVHPQHPALLTVAAGEGGCPALHGRSARSEQCPAKSPRASPAGLGSSSLGFFPSKHLLYLSHGCPGPPPVLRWPLLSMACLAKGISISTPAKASMHPCLRNWQQEWVSALENTPQPQELAHS